MENEVFGTPGHNTEMALLEVERTIDKVQAVKQESALSIHILSILKDEHKRLASQLQSELGLE